MGPFPFPVLAALWLGLALPGAGRAAPEPAALPSPAPGLLRDSVSLEIAGRPPLRVGEVDGSGSSLEVEPGGASSLLRPGERILATVILRRSGVGSQLPPGAGTRPDFFARGTLRIRNTGRIWEDPSGRSVGIIHRTRVHEPGVGTGGRLASRPPPGGTHLLEGYELGTRFRGTELEVPVSIPHEAPGPESWLLVDHSRSVEWTLEPELVEDPLDPAPLGDRRPVILVHGRWFGDRLFRRHLWKSLTWRQLRKAPGYRALFGKAKFYFFDYPTYEHPRDCAAALVRLAGERLGGPGGRDRPIVMIGMSLGALVMRWAMNQDRFGDRVALAITTAGPHHGTAGASLAYADPSIREVVGRSWGLVLRLMSAVQPDSPGLRSLTWDNHDGAVSPEHVARYGIRINPELAELNERDAFQDRLVCLAADVESLAGRGLDRGLLVELLRRAAGRYHRPWGNSDPVVPRDSALFAGGEPAGRHRYRNFGHTDMILHPRIVADLLTLLRHELRPDGSAVKPPRDKEASREPSLQE